MLCVNPTRWMSCKLHLHPTSVKKKKEKKTEKEMSNLLALSYCALLLIKIFPLRLSVSLAWLRCKVFAVLPGM